MTEAFTPDHLRDLALIERLNPLSDDPDFPEASFCLRLDASIEGNLSARPPGLANLLLGAYDLMQAHLVYYAAEAMYYEAADGSFARHGFPDSSGRKLRRADRDTLARIVDLAAETEAADRADQALRVAALQAAGLTPDPAAFGRARDGGSIVLADAWPLHLAQNLILLKKNGSECWSLSVGFSPVLWREQAPAIQALVARFAASGVCDSGCFGFALNSWDSLEEVAERLFRPVAERFAMINPMEPGDLCLTRRFHDRDRTFDTFMPVPVGAWTILSRSLLDTAPEGIDLPAALAGTGAVIEASDTGVLVRLWPDPVLGDVNHATSCAPARALHRALAPLRAGKSTAWATALRVGFEADRIAWLTRLEGTEA